jgi:predicted 2-oxoglutarate/Fe(II)-dependent dioxygenase YbiX
VLVGDRTSTTYNERELDDLRGAACAGEPAAACRLGARLLVGREAPFAPQEGLALIEQAAARDDADAVAHLATLTGAGAWTRQSWPEALRLLLRAAELGSADARAQLVMLAGDVDAADAARAGEPDNGVWQRLHASIDLERWVVPPLPRAVREAPRIWVVPGFTTPEICRWLIGRCQGRLQPSQMFDGQKTRFFATRTCRDFAFTIVDGGVLLVLLRIRIGLATSLPVPHMEPPQIFHYAVGQEIKAHYDSVYDGEHGYGQAGTYRGDRLATLLLYLNDDYEGGELEFVHTGFCHRGQAGDAIFFASLRDGKRDRLSLHAASPVTAGEKYIFSQWIHDRPFTA